MKFARNIIKLAAVTMLLLALVFVLSAAAEEDPVEFAIEVNPTSLTAPGKVNVSLRIANSADQDMSGPVTLYDPAGQVVASFGDGGSYLLKSAESRSWEGEWNVTQAELDAGKVTYTLKYSLTGADGQAAEYSRTADAAIEYAGERVELTVNRTVSPEVVRNGKSVTVTYELYNSGNVELKDIRVKENVDKKAQKVASLPAGERTTLTFTSRIGNADLTSSADISYKAANSTKTLTQKVDEVTVPVAKPGLKLELSSPTAGVNIGEAATLVITFTNNGNISYSNVSVVEAKKGEILTNLSIPAGATVTESTEYILKEPTTFVVTATLPDNTGETKTMKSNELSVGVFDPEKVMKLTLNLTADRETIGQAGEDVRMHLVVTNNSNIEAKNININYLDDTIYTINSLAPGASVPLDWDFTIKQAGQFRFSATVKDSLNNVVPFESNTIQISYTRPTAAPTRVPVVTVAPPEYVDPEETVKSPVGDIAGKVFLPAAILAGVALVLFLVSTIMRIKNRSHSNAAYDHLQLSERRDYTEPGGQDDGNFDDAGEEDLESTIPDLTDSEPELPHERLIRDAEKSVQEAVAEADQMTDGMLEGGYRVTRSEETENIPVPETPKEAPKPEAPVPELQVPETQAPEMQIPETKASEEADEDADAWGAQKSDSEDKPRRRHRRARRTEDEEQG